MTFLPVLALLVVGCSPLSATEAGRGESPATTATQSHPSPRDPQRPAFTPSGDPYVDLARQLHARGVEVWFEADLVRSWLDGASAFDDMVERLAVLSQVKGVSGFKIADELGYGDGLDTPKQVQQFLHDADVALDRVAPDKELLVDAVVPDLGCLPWHSSAGRSCGTEARRRYAAATMAAMSGYLRTGSIDRLDLSTGLLDPGTYAGWGLSLQEAQELAWEHVDSLGWAEHTTLQSRKALAEPGGYQGSSAEALADVATYVEAPIAGGAHAVDIWTWRQPYDGATVSLLDDQLRPNALWSLLDDQPSQVRLLTHMTPSAMPTDPAVLGPELDLASTVFDAVFVAAGSG